MKETKSDLSSRYYVAEVTLSDITRPFSDIRDCAEAEFLYFRNRRNTSYRVKQEWQSTPHHSGLPGMDDYVSWCGACARCR